MSIRFKSTEYVVRQDVPRPAAESDEKDLEAAAMPDELVEPFTRTLRRLTEVCVDDPLSPDYDTIAIKEAAYRVARAWKICGLPTVESIEAPWRKRIREIKRYVVRTCEGCGAPEGFDHAAGCPAGYIGRAASETDPRTADEICRRLADLAVERDMADAEVDRLRQKIQQLEGALYRAMMR